MSLFVRKDCCFTPDNSVALIHRAIFTLLCLVACTLPAAEQAPAGSGQPPAKGTKAPQAGPGLAPGSAPVVPPGKAPTSPPPSVPAVAPGQPGTTPGFTPGTPPGFAPGTPPGFAPSAPPGFPPGVSPLAPPGQLPGAPPGFPPGASPALPPGFVPVPVPVPVPAAEPAPGTVSYGPNVTFEEAIAALKTGDMSYRNLYWPLRVLRRLPVDAKRREEVAALLDPVVTTENLTIRRAAQDAIEGWGTKTNIPTLIKLLQYQDSGDRRAAMQALGAIGGSKEAAQAVAAKLLDKSDRLTAKSALAQMGTFAQEVIWQHVGASDDTLHRYACEVLGKVGTTKSLIKLRALRRDRDSSRQRALESVQKEMEKRLVKR